MPSLPEVFYEQEREHEFCMLHLSFGGPAPFLVNIKLIMQNERQSEKGGTSDRTRRQKEVAGRKRQTSACQTETADWIRGVCRSDRFMAGEIFIADKTYRVQKRILPLLFARGSRNVRARHNTMTSPEARDLESGPGRSVGKKASCRR